VLEATVRGARVDQIRHGELVDVPQPLHRLRVHHCSLITIEADERVDRITDLVLPLHHHIHSMID